MLYCKQKTTIMDKTATLTALLQPRLQTLLCTPEKPQLGSFYSHLVPYHDFCSQLLDTSWKRVTISTSGLMNTSTTNVVLHVAGALVVE